MKAGVLFSLRVPINVKGAVVGALASHIHAHGALTHTNIHMDTTWPTISPHAQPRKAPPALKPVSSRNFMFPVPQKQSSPSHSEHMCTNTHLWRVVMWQEVISNPPAHLGKQLLDQMGWLSLSRFTAWKQEARPEGQKKICLT